MWVLDELIGRKNSEDVAVVHRDNKFTYKELWEASEKVAQWINDNCSTRNPVLIYGNKDVEIVAIMLGALKTGRAYVPIDITFPEDRVKQIINITNAEVLFDVSGQEIECDLLKASIGKAALADILGKKEWEDSQSANWVQGDDNCYILFTSGSTGEPKGVQISKNNIINFVDWFCTEADVSGDVVLNQVSYSFDVSVIQLYIYLAMGKTLFCIDKDMISDFGELFKYLGKSGIASWVSTPAFIEMCAVYDAFDSTLLPNLTKIILAGEVLTKKLVKTLWKKFPKNGGVQIINGYGPTEGTVLLTCCTISQEMIDDEENELPIGYMMDDATYMIDRSIELPDGAEPEEKKEKGELVVSGASISKGYFKNDKATSQNFFMNFGDKYNSYRTGDVVYRTGEMIYYCGRKDFQIKLNGYRIELDDISENINKIPEISNNVVLPVYRDGRVAYIVAFVVLENDLGLTKVQTSVYIRKCLGQLVPSYMIPKKVVVLDAFPLNTNGKIDRKLLMETYL